MASCFSLEIISISLDTKIAQLQVVVLSISDICDHVEFIKFCAVLLLYLSTSIKFNVHPNPVTNEILASATTQLVKEVTSIIKHEELTDIRIN